MVNNNNIRAAKRRSINYTNFVWPYGFNGTSSSDFDHVSTNRTHEKSQKDANDKESDSIGESP